MTWDTKNLPAHKLGMQIILEGKEKKVYKSKALLLGEIHNQADIIGP